MVPIKSDQVWNAHLQLITKNMKEEKRTRIDGVIDSSNLQQIFRTRPLLVSNNFKIKYSDL